MANTPNLKHLAALVGAVALVALLAGCGTEAVCRSGLREYRLVAMSSLSDAHLARQAAAPVASEVATRAANTCGSIETGVDAPNPVADLELHSIALTPRVRSAPSRAPHVRVLEARARAFLRQNFVGPTERARGRFGSPLFGTLAAIASYRDQEKLPAGCTVFLTDSIAVERSPRGAIDFSAPPPPDERRRLDGFVDTLRPLRSEQIVILGAGAHSGLTLGQLEHAHRAIAYVLKRVHAHLTWSRALQLPKACA